MSELNDSSAIKLFGKMIPLLTLNQKEALADHESSFTEAVREDCCDRNLLSSSNSLGAVNSNDGVVQGQAHREDQEKHEDGPSLQIREERKDPIILSGIIYNGRSPLAERKTSSLESSKNEEKSETNASQEKALKKPDKILPCPRCHSKETKFCYHNNYNVNQPRHFCKNCQRYWTAGGAMRNIPVGAGRRKTKSSSALHHYMIYEAILEAQARPANGIHRNPSSENNNSCVLTFGSDSSLPVASVFNISGKSQIDAQKGVGQPQKRVLVEDNHSGESLITASYSLEKEGKARLNQTDDKNYQLFPSKVPCFTGPSWPYPWNSIQWSTAMLPPPPTLCRPGFPASFYTTPAYRTYSIPSPWDVPVASPSRASVNQCAPSPSSSPTSPSLGKHSRDENIFSPSNLEKEKPSGESNEPEGRTLNSKTLRIDDPDETAKSSMLATLMIKTKKTNSINSGGGLFDGFQSKTSDDRNCRLRTFSALQANPAALSRSLNFHENT